MANKSERDEAAEAYVNELDEQSVRTFAFTHVKAAYASGFTAGQKSKAVRGLVEALSACKPLVEKNAFGFQGHALEAFVDKAIATYEREVKGE